MSWLLTDEEFALASEGTRRGDVTPALYAFLRRVVTALTRGGGLAPALSPTGRWDEEAIGEVLQGWLSERLLRGGLARAFQVSASPGALSRYLERALRNWLVSKSRTKGRPRLLARTRRLLDEGATYRKFVDASTPLDQWWGLATWESPTPYMGREEEVVKAAFSVGDLAPLRYTAGSTLTDPVISNADLARLLSGILESVGALLTLRHFDAALRGRFAYAYHEGEEPLEVIEEPTDQVTPLDTIEARLTAREILFELSGRQVAVLRDRTEGRLTLEDLARRHSISRGTVDNELRRASAIIRAHLLDDSQAETVLENLFEIAFEEDGGRA
jgi:DNA-binding CsgD family transcriptional regulator